MAGRWKIGMFFVAMFVMAHFVHASENDADQVRLSSVVVQHLNLTASGFIHVTLELE